MGWGDGVADVMERFINIEALMSEDKRTAVLLKMGLQLGDQWRFVRIIDNI